MGTSDPVRGYHDGPMLHIIRHYRPEVICVFLSGEAAALDGCGARLDTVLSHVQNNWGGYEPELRVVRTQIAVSYTHLDVYKRQCRARS